MTSANILLSLPKRRFLDILPLRILAYCPYGLIPPIPHLRRVCELDSLPVTFVCLSSKPPFPATSPSRGLPLHPQPHRAHCEHPSLQLNLPFLNAAHKHSRFSPPQASSRSTQCTLTVTGVRRALPGQNFLTRCIISYTEIFLFNERQIIALSVSTTYVAGDVLGYSKST